MRNSSAFLVSVVATLFALGLALLVDDGATRVAGLPLLPALALFGFAVQWLVFVPSFLRQTEHYYDLAGALTYASVILLAASLASPDVRGWVITALVLIWCGRLGSFLFLRVKRIGKDGRFDDLKPYWGRFLMAWTLQGLWVFVTLLAALIAVTSPASASWDVWATLGLLIWAGGFAIEAIADHQKNVFKAEPANHGRFIRQGLWAWSRHPNYFGEIMLWTGIAVMATPALTGWQWLGWVSPLFVCWLLVKVSGIPMLEQRADEKWGGQADYEAYKASTPVLVPRPPRRAAR
ncbi:DUF1295 domain-containing protein [Aquisalimonas sp. 2447]|uniref:DUF1295 domain-containing protein n=1 Tax=Aquisalimonas sp. 2447 TaxID=2740807 RepID=UPI0014323E08|nr:DUF1295 domain-containing protein [Aquisalimonas sp. 2447]QIT55998.1 DUF1295 domain-containing protein [Aquisalimonas sp. 2447]